MNKNIPFTRFVSFSVESFKLRNMKKILLSAAFIILAVISTQAQVDASLFRFPDVSQNQITFVYGGDIWVVSKNGGFASRLSSPPGEEIFPKFSPDGKTIAYSGNYDGNVDVYTVSAMGGVPKRITYNSLTDRVVDWNPDGKSILFASMRESGRQRFDRLFSISTEGGLAQVLPPAYAEMGCYSPDGKQLAFTAKSRLNRTWKRYRGGWAPDIYVMNLDNFATTNITNNDASDELPMWHNNRIYYVSDNGPEERYNIWVYDMNTKSSEQLTHFTDYDIHYPSIGPEDIVFEAGGDLYLFNLSSGDYKKVDIKVVTDQMTVLPKTENVASYVQHYNVSPDGNRALIEARGDIFSLPAEKGYVKNLTQSSGSGERFPSWSPDGTMVAYWSDASGEYELTIYNAEKGTTRQVTNLGPGFRYKIYWSPDNKKIVFADQTMNINICDVATGQTKAIDKGLWLFQGGLESFKVSWSADSRFVTWSRGMDNRNSAIFIYDTQNDNKTQITNDFYNNYSPAFDPEGKYLYLLTNRALNPSYSSFDNTFIYDNSTLVAAISLQKDTPSLLEPENDAVKKDDDKKEDKEEKEEKASSKKKKAKNEKSEKEEEPEVKPVKIDFQGLEDRLVLLPVDAGDYSDLTAAKGKIIFQDNTNAEQKNGKRPIVYWDTKDRELKTIIDNASGYILAANAEKMLVVEQGKASIIDVKENQKMDKMVPVQEMEMTIHPKEEWQQIFTDAWRMERDFFYDKNMHGVDWKAMKTKYEKLLKECVTREDVNFVIGELIGEINSSHTYKGGGDLEKTKHRNVGYLGIDWKINNGAYQVANIIQGAEWDAEARSPLQEPGVDVQVGDYILAVNGTPISTDKEPYAAFEGLGGKTVELLVGKTPSISDAKKVIVKTLTSEARLRHLAWIETKRERVNEETKGKAGYIYVRSTGIDGQNELVRQFYGQWNKDALIIDERFNSGGQIPDRFIELLNRKNLAYWAVRDGKDWQWPPVAHFGPEVMLINGWSGSGGDAFPDFFRKAKLGPLIGTRTWGGLIGMSGAPSLIDGGMVTTPSFRMYDPDGKWFKEGHGVDPDIKVPENYTELAKGIDNQLEKAIQVVKEELKKNPVKKPQRPPYEKR